MLTSNRTKSPSRPRNNASPVLLFGTLALALLPSACVRSGTYDEAMNDLRAARSQVEAYRDQLEEERNRAAKREARLRDRIREMEGELEGRIEELGMARREYLRAQERITELDLEIQRLNNLLNATGAEAQQLQNRLDQLAAIEAEVRETRRIYEEVLRRFRDQIEAGRLSVSIAQGRMVINLPQDILFASGSATLGSEGRRTIGAVAHVLEAIEGREFQVEGHTDDDAISTAEFPSNWELSAARALSVVKLLVDNGVPPETLSGAAYGEFDPIADNESPRGKRLNRRIEIVMLPNLDVIADASPGG